MKWNKKKWWAPILSIVISIAIGYLVAELNYRLDDHDGSRDRLYGTVVLLGMFGFHYYVLKGSLWENR